MKILFINAQDIIGGASIAPYRLSKGLEAQFNTENYFIVGKKSSSDANVFATRKNELQTLIEVFTDKVMNKLGLQYKYFPFSPRFILKKTRELKPDIISLHNIHEGYFRTSLLKKLSKIAPIAWTLHDMWSFTGNAAATFGDESWKEMKTSDAETRTYPHIGINTGRMLLKQKRRIYSKSDLHIITPSTWMTEQARQSPVFENKPIHTIAHGLDLELFRPKDRLSSRKALDISPYAKVLVFTSAGDLDICPWKGGPLLIDILKEIDRKTNAPIDVLAVGKGQLEQVKQLKNIKLHKTGYVSNENYMSLLLSASDLFIYPTRADSFGLVLAESIACGTPAITFDIGGCSDIIQNGTSGVLIPPFDVDIFAEQALALLNDEEKLNELSVSARRFSEHHFSLTDMAKKHYELFESIIPEKSDEKK